MWMSREIVLKTTYSLFSISGKYSDILIYKVDNSISVFVNSAAHTVLLDQCQRNGIKYGSIVIDRLYGNLSIFIQKAPFIIVCTKNSFSVIPIRRDIVLGRGQDLCSVFVENDVHPVFF